MISYSGDILKKGYDITDMLKELGWSQIKLSIRLGVHKNTVWRWCKGYAPQHVVEYLQIKIDHRRMSE